ncbi:Store-operated calcium entry-associated regulatory factor [Geranomyces variabilis]|nr:Store-operated calcium entry-associated regulatory factor [Geranomyces variabilis]
MFKALVFAALLGFSTAVVADVAEPANDTRTPAMYDVPKIKLSDVDAIVFRRDLFTAGRRTHSKAQLSCQSTECYSQLLSTAVGPTAVRCTNLGWTRGEVEWDCVMTEFRANDDPTEFYMRNPVVHCEGYQYEHDPWILAGSCSLQYRLHRTPEAEQRYQAAVSQKQRDRVYANDPWGHHHYWRNSVSSGVADLVRVVAYGAVAYFVYTLVFAPGGGGLGGRGRAGDGQVLERLFFVSFVLSLMDNIRRRF